MMNCRNVAQNASRLLDGDLGMWMRWCIRWHLRLCEHCRRYVTLLQLAMDVLRAHAADIPELDDPALRALAARLRASRNA